MLRGIPFEISPKLLRTLAEMGHGDRICIGDMFFPANSNAKEVRIIRADGIDAGTLTDAILKLMPLDDWTEYSVIFLGQPDEKGVPGPSETTQEISKIISKYDENAAKTAKYVERFAFYDLTKECYAVISSGESRTYGCLILQKGVK